MNHFLASLTAEGLGKLRNIRDHVVDAKPGSEYGSVVTTKRATSGLIFEHHE